MPKLLPKADQIAQAWLNEAKDSPEGAETFIPADSKKEARAMVKKLRELRDKLSRDEPIVASKLDIKEVFRDSRHWVMVKKKLTSPLEGFTKLPDGTVQRKVISFDPERRRKIKLMLADGLPLEDINSILDSPMTPAETREFVEKGRLS